MSNVYNEVLINVQKKIQAAVALSLTTDGWTSSNNESYIAITAHFIDGETKLCSALLTCQANNDKHTSQNLCNFLKDAMVEWNISHKVAAVVSDNTGNIIAVVRTWRMAVSRMFRSSSKSSCPKRYKGNIRCFSASQKYC